MAFPPGRLLSEKSFVVVTVVLLLLFLCRQNFVDFQSSQQQALKEVPSNLEVKCRRAEHYCFTLLSFFSRSLLFMKEETTQENPEDYFQEKEEYLAVKLTTDKNRKGIEGILKWPFST